MENDERCHSSRHLEEQKTRKKESGGINNEKERPVQTRSNYFKGLCEFGLCDLFANGELK